MDTVPLLPVAPISSSTAHNLDGTSLLQSPKHDLGFAISHTSQRLKTRPSPYWAPNEPCVVNRKVARPHRPVGYLQRFPAWTEIFSILGTRCDTPTLFVSILGYRGTEGLLLYDIRGLPGSKFRTHDYIRSRNYL
jgi:hypothetical protein